MGTKTIAIMDDVYDILASLKAPDESFSDELRRLAKTRGPIIDLAGSWSDLTAKEARKMKAAIINMRKSKRLDEIKKRLE